MIDSIGDDLSTDALMILTVLIAFATSEQQTG